MTFREWLKSRMAERKLSLHDLVDYLGVGHRAVENWLYGRYLPNADNLRRLAMLFETPEREIPLTREKRMPRRKPLSPMQVQILLACAAEGGTCHYRYLSNHLFGRWEISGSERAALYVNVYGLVRRGLLNWTRQWGTLEYGQVLDISLTDAGWEKVKELHGNVPLAGKA